jgi:hypothetical protein
MAGIKRNSTSSVALNGSELDKVTRETEESAPLIFIEISHSISVLSMADSFSGNHKIASSFFVASCVYF